PCGETNPIPRSADFILASRQGAISQALSSLDDDPEQAARAMELSAATGVPAPIVNGNLENFERQQKAALTASLLNSNEYLRSFINDNPMAAKVANDDYANLDSISQKVSELNLGRGVAHTFTNAFSAMLKPDPAFEEGFGQAPFPGSWIDPEDAKKYPETARALGALGSPIELALRTISGMMKSITEEVRSSAETLDPVLGKGFGREMGGLVEAEMMGLTGRHGVGPSVDMVAKVRPWVENGREPPPGVLPELDKFRTEQNATDLDALKETTQEAQKSQLRERDPELFRQFIAQHTDAEIGISGEAVAALYGDKLPEAEDNLLGLVPGIAEKLELARETGTDVHIPLADWLANVDPKVMDALKEDIRVRPNGITKNEAVRAAEVEAAASKAEPLPGEVPSARAANALEPMFSIGDRKLELKRLAGAEGSRFGPEQGFHDFSINDEKGNPVGTINLSEAKGGKQLYIEMINGIGGLGPRDFGPVLMRSLLAQLKTEFPNAESITGHRVSGARERLGTWEGKSAQPVIKLDNPKGWETIETTNEWRRLLEGGTWETYSPSVRGYIKPYAERTLEDRQMIDAV